MRRRHAQVPPAKMSQAHVNEALTMSEDNVNEALTHVDPYSWRVTFKLFTDRRVLASYPHSGIQMEERCPPRQKTSVERLRAKVEALSSSVTVEYPGSKRAIGPTVCNAVGTNGGSYG